MTTPEPSFTVPLSEMVSFRMSWRCLLCGDEWAEQAPSESEARAAAIAHLAEVHGIHPTGHEPSKSWVKTDGPYVPDEGIDDEPDAPRWELMHDEF